MTTTATTTTTLTTYSRKQADEIQKSIYLKCQIFQIITFSILMKLICPFISV